MRMYFYPCPPAFSLVSFRPPLVGMILWEQRSSGVQNLPTASLFAQSKTCFSPVACELPQWAPSSVHWPLCCSSLSPSAPSLWPASWSWSPAASGPLLSLNAHSLILLVSLEYHLPSAAFPNPLFETVIPHIHCRVLQSASFFSTAISRTTNTITISNPVLLIYCVYYLLPPLECRSPEDSSDICLLRRDVVQSLSLADSLWPHELQHARLPCASLSPRVCLKLMFLESVMPSNHLILSSPPSFPALSLSEHQGLFQWFGPLHQVARVLELQHQYQPFQWVFRTDFL